MGPGSVLIELFHRSYAHDIRGGNVGRQQLFRGSDMYYASAALLEANCSQGGWKFDPKCPSIVNISELADFLAVVKHQLTVDWWPGRAGAASTAAAPAVRVATEFSVLSLPSTSPPRFR